MWRQDKNAARDFMSGALPSNAIGSLCHDAAHHTLYAGTGEANTSGDSEVGLGVFKSTDGGVNWTALGGNSVFRPGDRGDGHRPDRPELHLRVNHARSARCLIGDRWVCVVDPGAAKWGLNKSTNGGASFTHPQRLGRPDPLH